jgi:CxxC-x17-CxxC domain-containing protein
MGRFFNDRNSGGRSRGRFDKPEMHKAVCDECHQDCEVPFKPSGNKPIYCSRCFEKVDTKKFSSKGEKSSSVDMSPVTEQLSSINAKLETLIEMLSEKKVVKKAKK